MNTNIEGTPSGRTCATCRICQVKILLPENMDLSAAIDRLLDFAADHEKCQPFRPKKRS